MFKTHGLTQHPIYSVYHNMMTRCYYKNCKSYKDYGEKGITVCDEWKNDCTSFVKWAESNGWGKNLRIDRKENSKGYSPENCRFVTVQQSSENKTTSRYATYNGETKLIKEWARILGKSYTRLRTLIVKNGVPPEVAFNRKRGAGSRVGSKNNKAKLKESDIPVIRQLLLDGVSVKTIAKNYSMSSHPILMIKNNRTWKHVKLNEILNTNY